MLHRRVHLAKSGQWYRLAAVGCCTSQAYTRLAPCLLAIIANSPSQGIKSSNFKRVAKSCLCLCQCQAQRRPVLAEARPEWLLRSNCFSPRPAAYPHTLGIHLVLATRPRRPSSSACQLFRRSCCDGTKLARTVECAEAATGRQGSARCVAACHAGVVQSVHVQQAAAAGICHQAARVIELDLHHRQFRSPFSWPATYRHLHPCALGARPKPRPDIQVFR